MPLRRIIVTVTLLAIAATACGSSSKSASTNAPTTTAAASPGSPTTSGGSSGTPTTKKLSGDSGSSFCDLVRKDQNVFKGNQFTGSTPADLKKLYDNIGPALDEARSKAPSEIKDDFGTLVTGLKTLTDALAAVNYDFTKLSPSSLTSLESPKFRAASDHIDQYMTQVCHITTTT